MALPGITVDVVDEDTPGATEAVAEVDTLLEPDTVDVEDAEAPGANEAVFDPDTLPEADTVDVVDADTPGAREAVTELDTVLEIDTAGVVHLGGAAGELVALANLVTTQLTALKTAINGAAVVPGDGGAAFKAAIMAALASWPATVAATKTKAT